MGIGDDIMATGQVRELRQDESYARIFVGDGANPYWSPAFDNNPHISRHNPQDCDLWIINKPGNRPYIDYTKGVNKRISFTGWRASPGELYFSKIESVEAAKLLAASGVERKQFIVIEPNIKALFSGQNKDWGWNKWESLMPMLRGIDVVQFDYGKPILDDVKAIKTPDFRLACAVLQHAAALVTTDGGLHHAAAALNIPGVVIWGGYSSPHHLGYDLHENIFPDDPDSPCGVRVECSHCRRVMDSIQPSHVAERIEKCLNDQKAENLSLA